MSSASVAIQRVAARASDYCLGSNPQLDSSYGYFNNNTCSTHTTLLSLPCQEAWIRIP